MPHPLWRSWIVVLPLCASLVLVQAGASAADLASGGLTRSMPAEPSWLSRPISVAGQALQLVGNEAAALWGSFTSAFVSPPAMEVLPGQLSDEDRQFFAIFETMGLKLSEIKIGGSFLSSDSYRLVADRQPSEADLARADRALDDYRTTFTGMRTWARQKIVHTVMDLESDKGFVVSAVVVTMSAWPSVSYELNARDRPLEPGERRVTEKLQGQ